MEKPVIYIDTDISLGTPGAEIDDGAALFVLLGSQQYTIAGIGSVFGNVPINDATQNLSRLLYLLGKDGIPVGEGADAPMAGDMDWFKEWANGYSPTLPYKFNKPSKSSAQLLINLVRAHPGQVTILAIGPLTNLAKALQAAPGIEKQVKNVIAMGGSFGSQPQESEFNIHCDAEAARMVFQADWPLTLLGLELTRQIAFSKQDFANLKSQHPAVKLFQQQASGWIERVEAMGWEKNGCSLHDAVAAAYLLQPDLFSTADATVEVSMGAPYPKGTTITQPAKNQGQHTIKIITQVDVKKCKELIWSFIDL